MCTYCCIIKYLHFRFAILLVLSCACKKGVSMIMCMQQYLSLYTYTFVYMKCVVHTVYMKWNHNTIYPGSPGSWF